MQEDNNANRAAGISFSWKGACVHIYQNTIKALGSPRYVRFLFDDQKKHLVMVCCNLPLLYLGFGKVQKAFEYFECQEGIFNSNTIGESLPVWDENRVLMVKQTKLALGFHPSFRAIVNLCSFCYN
jgi:hypothetical protein